MRCIAVFFYALAVTLTPSFTFAENVLFSTSYEPSTYQVGALVGQDSWTGFGDPAQITSDRSMTGAQSVLFDLNTNFSFNQRTGSYSTSAPILTMRQAIYIERPDSGAEILENFFIRPFLANGDNPNNVNGGDFVGQVVVIDGISSSGLVASLEAGNGDLGLVPVELDEWFVLEHVINLETQTQEAFLNGQLFATSAFANPANSLSGGENLVIGKDNHNVFLDDLSVTSVPEPGSIAMLGFCSFAILGRRSRRR